MFHQSSILPFVLPLQSLFLWIFLSLFCASRFSASFQAGFKQLCETSKCPSLCRLFRKDDNDKPNPADLQLIALFHHPSTVILRPPPPSPNFFTSGCAALISKCPYLFNKASDILLLTLISISAYRRCPALLPFSFSGIPFLYLIPHHSWPIASHTTLVQAKTCVPRQVMKNDHKQADLPVDRLEDIANGSK